MSDNNNEDDDSVGKQWSSVHFLAAESVECTPRHGAFACGGGSRDDTSVTSVTSHPEDTTTHHDEDDDDNPIVFSSPSRRPLSHNPTEENDDDEDSLAEQWTRVRRESEHQHRQQVHDAACNDETSVTSFTSQHDETENPSEREQQRPSSSLSGRPQVPASYQRLVDSGIIQFPDVEYGTNPGLAQEHLVVAQPVMEPSNSEDPELPAAVEYDPDAKPQATLKSRKWLYVTLGCCALLLTAVVIVVGLVISKNSNDEELHPRQQVGIRQEILTLVEDEWILQDPRSPYSKALQWITFDDPMQVIPQDDNFLQRYLMAYFYFATTETQPWSVCNPTQESITNSTTQATTDKASSSGSSSSGSSCPFLPIISASGRDQFRYSSVPLAANRWLSRTHECSWAGVSCNQDSNKVESIKLNGQNLNGVFPEGLVHLSSLQGLELFLNKLRGEIPKNINALTSMEFLDLRFNSLVGTIPDELWELTKLISLDMRDNQFTGTLSSRLSKLTDLESLEWGQNDLTGIFPKEIVALTKLKTLSLEVNSFHGKIPVELGMATRLERLSLFDNDFSGTLPSGVALFSSLRFLLLQNNHLLSGEFPPGIWDIKRMEGIDIEGCNFSGSIGSGVGNMDLHFLKVSGNPFSGTVPPELSRNTNLFSLWIHGTNIQGPMPDEVCATQEAYQKLGSVFWDDVSADCLGDTPKFACDCCTECCKADGSRCEEVLD